MARALAQNPAAAADWTHTPPLLSSPALPLDAFLASPFFSALRPKSGPGWCYLRPRTERDLSSATDPWLQVRTCCCPWAGVWTVIGDRPSPWILLRFQPKSLE